jgi:hypothetical protein
MKVTILVPDAIDSDWAAIENVIHDVDNSETNVTGQTTTNQNTETVIGQLPQEIISQIPESQPLPPDLLGDVAVEGGKSDILNASDIKIKIKNNSQTPEAVDPGQPDVTPSVRKHPESVPQPQVQNTAQRISEMEI